MAGPQFEAGDFILIVADEEESCPANDLMAFEPEAQIQKRKSPQRMNYRPKKRWPLAAAELLLLCFTFDHDAGIQPKTGVIDKDAVVHHPDIYIRDMTQRD